MVSTGASPGRLAFRRSPGARAAAAVRGVLGAAFLAFGLPWPAAGQRPAPDSARIVRVARELMRGAHFGTLVTVDAAGRAQARTVEPFDPDTDLTIWVGTNPRTRKVAEIRRDPRVTLHYFDPKAGGYVTLLGRAALVDDAREKAARFRAAWASFYPDRGRDYLLIRIVPERLEVVSPGHGVAGDSLTWRPPAVDFRRR